MRNDAKLVVFWEMNSYSLYKKSSKEFKEMINKCNIFVENNIMKSLTKLRSNKE